MVKRSIFAFFLSILGILVAVPAASACINEVYDTLERDTNRVVRIERQLSRGHAARALRAAERFLLDAHWETPSDLNNRARTVRARAFIRVAFESRPSTWSRHQTETRVAITQLRALEDSPQLRAAMAEGAVVIGDLEAAGSLLRELSRQDLMPDAFSYRVLAHVEREAGNAQAADEAQAICETRAGRAARRVCGAAPARSDV